MKGEIPTKIHEELPRLHLEAQNLTCDDLVTLKHSLQNLITKSSGLLEIVRSALHEQRRANMEDCH